MPELLAHDLSVTRGNKRVLESVSLHARAGEVLAILGPNGAGKSTLLRALLGLSDYAGRVEIDGLDAHSLTSRQRAQLLAFVPQQTALRSALPVQEVVAQGRYMHRPSFGSKSTADRAAVQAALQTCDLVRFSTRPFTSLSIGEQRRVLIARALATGARILCLDEPTASLDVHHVLRLHALLRDLARTGHTVITSLHSLDDALHHTDRALLLDRGRTITSGLCAEVIEAQRVREVYGVELSHGAALGFALTKDAP